MKRLTSILFLLLALTPVAAHEVRPSYLDMQEERAGEFSVLWKTPMRGNMRLALTPDISGDIKVLTPVATRMTGDAAVQTWRIRVDRLPGRTLRVANLEDTLTDAFVRIAFVDGSVWAQRLTPSAPASLIPETPDGLSVSGMYLKLGLEHILLGIDHLLFVLALLLLTKGIWPLVKTVTAFTVAHSITLALATLGFVHVPSKPVEAVIALSIVFIAAEIVHARQGRRKLAAEMPWVVAFTFGLLHGFGFANALTEMGLPDAHIPVALLFFNIGVEIGQLLFVATALALGALVSRLPLSVPRWAELAPTYAIGGVAGFWVIERVAAF